MPVHLSLLLIPLHVHVRVEENLGKRDKQVRQEPYVDHLDVGRGRQGARDADEEGCEDKEGSEVHSDGGFKEEGSEKY